MSSPEPKSAGDALERFATQLARLRDLILAKNHKATRELQDAVGVVANELDIMAANLRKSAPVVGALPGEAAVQAHLALLEAKDKLTLLDDIIRRAIQGAAQSSSFIGDTARLKLALARMEATDLFEEKRRQWKEERRRLESITASAVRELDDRLANLEAPHTPRT